jgi:hypothetical protein
MASSWQKFIVPVNAHFRSNRGKVIREIFPDIEEATILDLGGSLHFWECVGIKPKNLTILNVSVDRITQDAQESNDVTMQVYDGATIPYPNQHFDILVCNSVIEHIQPEDRANIASEIHRVAKRHYIQTPAYEFPIEPHFIAPFIHWLPRSIGRWLACYSLYAFLSPYGRNDVIGYFNSTKLLTRKEMCGLFPWLGIKAESFMGLRKSHIAIN